LKVGKNNATIIFMALCFSQWVKYNPL
jgi:hypothetical protein